MPVKHFILPNYIQAECLLRRKILLRQYSEADKLNISVMLKGLFAYFDFTSESLEWHKRVAKELWDKYGHHPSFYAFYVPEERGSLDNWRQLLKNRLCKTANRRIFQSI